MSAHDSAAYRANAKDCADMALQIADRDTRLLFLTLADAWLRLADYVDARGHNETTQSPESGEVAEPRQTQGEAEQDKE